MDKRRNTADNELKNTQKDCKTSEATTNVMKVSVTYNGQVYSDRITMDSIKQAYRKAYEKAYSL
jgi:hypothetical protein